MDVDVTERFGPQSDWATRIQRARDLGDQAQLKMLWRERDDAIESAQLAEAQERRRTEQDAHPVVQEHLGKIRAAEEAGDAALAQELRYGLDAVRDTARNLAFRDAMAGSCDPVGPPEPARRLRHIEQHPDFKHIQQRLQEAHSVNDVEAIVRAQAAEKALRAKFDAGELDFGQTLTLDEVDAALIDQLETARSKMYGGG